MKSQKSDNFDNAAERGIEKQLRIGIKRLGGMCLKWVSPGTAGVPDRIVFLPNGRVLFVELKTDTGKLSRLQQATIARLQRLGQDVRVVHGKREVEALLAELSNGASKFGGDSFDV